ncbi:MAG TPA: hypothetical protein PLA74_00515 [Syntrophales bacterium]|nr:hypothetical protein [Syntrophales bacterium]HPQ43005.1 hypothetical protein [Syntrophales bacterium]
MSESRCCHLFLFILIILFLPVCAWGGVVPAKVIAKVGDIRPGADGYPISAINLAFTNGEGQLGFIGSVQRTTGSDAFVWYDDGFTWFNSNNALLSGAELDMGIGDDGRYIYSPSYDVNYDDAVWTHDGLLLVETDPSPGIAGMFVSFNSRPSMLPDGTAYWVAGLTSTEGGQSEGRVLYRSADTATPVITTVIKSGDLIGGFTIDAPSGIGFDYMVSDNDLHHIHDLTMDTGSSLNDEFIYVDGSLVVREGSPASGGTGGENWGTFDKVTINNAGTYLFSGDTDGDYTTDEYIAYNGTISLREGQTVDGIALATAATVNGLAINNRNQAVHLWTVGGGGKHLFFAKSAANLGKSVRVLSTGDMIDVNGDGVGDYTVTDLKSNISGMRYNAWLAEDGNLFVKVELSGGITPVDAIIRLSLPAGSVNPALPLLLLGN